VSIHPDISLWRLCNQRLLGGSFESAVDAVRHLIAAQAQEYDLAKWSLAQRVPGATTASIEEALDAGAILRTHMLRPTWHFVLPEDIRWVLRVTSPRVQAFNALYYRKLELDSRTLARGIDVMLRALEGGRYLTRPELAEALRRERIEASGQRLAYVVMHAELEGHICSGPRRGKQHTYAVLDERAPAARVPDADEALARLTRRFFAGHGPATEKDFRWWSSLRAPEVRRGLAMLDGVVERVDMNGTVFWHAEPPPPVEPGNSHARLLQGFDECVVPYADSRWVIDRAGLANNLPETHNFFVHPLLVDGQIAGMWRRVAKPRTITVELRTARTFEDAERQALQAELARYRAFSGIEVRLAYR
jgi:hypothetical protein